MNKKETSEIALSEHNLIAIDPKERLPELLDRGLKYKCNPLMRPYWDTMK